MEKRKFSYVSLNTLKPYKNKPQEHWDQLVLSEWHGIPRNKDVWIKIQKCERDIILDFKELEAIYKYAKMYKARKVLV